jgi:hypothetical protein
MRNDSMTSEGHSERRMPKKTQCSESGSFGRNGPKSILKHDCSGMRASRLMHNAPNSFCWLGCHLVNYLPSTRYKKDTFQGLGKGKSMEINTSNQYFSGLLIRSKKTNRSENDIQTQSIDPKSM